LIARAAMGGIGAEVEASRLRRAISLRARATTRAIVAGLPERTQPAACSAVCFVEVQILAARSAGAEAGPLTLTARFRAVLRRATGVSAGAAVLRVCIGHAGFAAVDAARTLTAAESAAFAVLTSFAAGPAVLGIGIEIGARATAHAEPKLSATTGRCRAGLRGTTRLATGAAVRAARLGVDAHAIALGLATGADAFASRANEAVVASVPTLTAIFRVRCLVDAAHAIAEVRSNTGRTRARTLFAHLSLGAGRLAVTAVIAIALKGDAADTGAIVGLSSSFARTLAGVAGAFAAAAVPAFPAILLVRRERGAAITAGIRCRERTATFPRLTDLAR